RWVPYAPTRDHRAPARPRAVHVSRTRIADPLQPPPQRRLRPRRGDQGPCHLALPPLRELMQLATRRVYAGRVVRLDVDTVGCPDGSTGELEMIRHPGAAAVVPCASDVAGGDPTILMLKQYRYA